MASNVVPTQMPSLPRVVEGAALGDATHSAMMAIHGIGALMTGVSLSFAVDTGTVTFSILSTLPGWPRVYAFVLAVSGFCLIVCRIRGGRPRLGAVALGFMCAWYTLFSASFAATWLLWFVHGGETMPNLYPASVYGTLAVLTGTHLSLILRRNRSGLGGQCPTQPGDLCG